MKTNITFFFALFLFLNMQAQETTEKSFGIQFSGFLKYDAFYDTRETVSIREGHFLLYPAGEALDAYGNDINAVSSFNMLSIQSRLTGKITGPDCFGAKTSGILEADFFGNENANFSDVNGFRLRHAIVKMNWNNGIELLAGQYWNPMFVTDVFPGVVSFNTGAPFNPFSRNPQIKISKTLSALKIGVTAYAQRDFTSLGPVGGSSKYLRNASVPDVNINAQFNAGDHVFGLGYDYKILAPRTSAEYTLAADATINGTAYPAGSKVKFAVDERVSALTAIAYMKLKTKPVTFKLFGIYAQNAADLTMLGGYAVKEITNIETTESDYMPLNTASVWTEIHTNGKTEFGLFAGYTKNMGTPEDIAGSVYARGANIASVIRISPRIVFKNERVNFAIEPEHTIADYGTPDVRSIPQDVKSFGNTRLLFSVIYKF